MGHKGGKRGRVMRVWVALFAVLLVVVVDGLSLGLRGIEENNECHRLDTCGKCAGVETCGWCASIQICMPGELIGPDYGNCTQWSYNYCKDEPCSYYESIGCESCINDPFCGYCGDEGRCLEGTTRGPLMDECSGGWLIDDCPPVNVTALLHPAPPGWYEDHNDTMESLVNEVVQRNDIGDATH